MCVCVCVCVRVCVRVCAGGLVAGLALLKARAARRRATREKLRTARQIDDLRAVLASTREQLRRLAEDMFVLRRLLDERNLIGNGELVRARGRLIEAPQRCADERAALTRSLHIEPEQVVLGDGDTQIH